MPEPPFQPNQQSSWRYSRHVGNYASPAELPNVAAAAVQSPRLFAGSVAYSISDMTLYLCLDATEGAAMWTAIAAGGGPNTDRRTAKLIVGNALNGDTATEVDFLDPGDGSGIAAALAAIPAGGGDVFIKAGLYDLSLGAVTGPFVIPTGVRVWGAGGLLASAASGTRIAMRADDVNITAFELGVAANLSDIAITVPPPTVATTIGDGIVEADSRATVQRVTINMSGDTYVTANFAALGATGAFRVGLNAGGLPEGTSFINCRGVNLPRFEDDVTVGSFAGFIAPNDGVLIGAQQLACQLSNCTTDGGDVGVQQSSVADEPTTLIIAGHIIKNVSLFGVAFVRGDRSSVIGCTITIDGVAPGTTRGIRVVNATDETEHMVIEANIVATRDAAPAVGSVGIELLSVGVGTVVECTLGNNIIVAQFDTGVSLSVGSDRNIVNSNIVHSGAATVVADAGAGNDVAHNI